MGFTYLNTYPFVLASNISDVTPIQQDDHSIYNIEGQKFSGSTQFRYYNNFELTQGDIANLIYKLGYDKFINLVNNQVNINGVLNTMRGNNFFNGHAIFVSPNGIIIGASGVLNVGSLSVLTPSQNKFDDFLEKYNSGDLAGYEYNANDYKGLITDSHGNIVINGRILAREDVNLYGDNISIKGTSDNKAGIIAGVNNGVNYENLESAKSAQVQESKKEQQSKMQNLEKWLKTAQEDIQKQQSKEGKEKLLKKYNTEFANKKETIAKDYQAKLKVIDKSITETITTKAKALGYDMVISKSMVIAGGDDITAEIKKIVK